MATSAGSLEGLDRRRSELEQNVEKLQKAVRYWQTWEAEYEGFKEEILKLKSNATAEDIQAVADDFGGDILTAKECRDILLSNSGTSRDAAQITNVLSRRIEYVQENVKTAQKQALAAESKVDAFNSVLEVQPRDEDGLPLQEITEMLDENDNVISSDVVDTTAVAPQILENLRKMGVKDISEDVNNKATAKSSSFSSATASLQPPKSASNQSPAATDTPAQVNVEAQKIDTVSPVDSTSVTAEKLRNAVSAGEVPSAGPRTVHEHVLRSLNEDLPANPTIPSNETPEEAALRREMLDYNMNEVGAVVATMNFDQNREDNDADSNDDYDDEDSYDDEEDSDGSEDEYGRTTVRVIDEKYRQEMQELEARLNARAIVNVGKTLPKNVELDRVEKAALEELDRPAPPPKAANSKKKGVRFAESLDISEPPPAPPVREFAERPIAEAVVERTGPASVAPTAAKQGVSRFSAGRSKAGGDLARTPKSQDSPSIPSGPLAGMHSSMLAPLSGNHTQSTSFETSGSGADKPRAILAEKLVERSADDEFDPVTLNQEIVSEYDRMLEKLVRQDGASFDPDVDVEDGQEREEPKISRFKAAKLSRK